MKIRFVVIGKTEEEYLRIGISGYLDRIKRYVPIEYLNSRHLKMQPLYQYLNSNYGNREVFMKHIHKGETIILLDERGKQLGSKKKLAQYLNLRMLSGIKSLVFLAGGP